MTNEVRVNQSLIDRVRKAREMIPEYNPSKEVLEKWNIDKMGDQCKAFTEADFAVVVVYALRTCPHVVLKAILDELEGKNNERNNSNSY